MTVHGYLAVPGFEAELEAELGSVRERHGRLFLAEPPARPVAWAQNVWLEPTEIAFQSVKEAARRLRELSRGWALLPHAEHRRAALIAEHLPHVSFRPWRFGDPAPSAPLGSWLLLDRHRLLAAPRCTSPFRHGEVEFEEDRGGPPNRAYLKLWEALTLFGELPEPGQTCLDLGSSPGGWTWVFARRGARVTSVDKAELAPEVAAMPEVTFRQESAFALDPEELGAVDWLASDVICYPERLLRLVERFRAAGTVARMICTLKFQGETDHDATRAFQDIPGSRVLHLHHNKHELTWMWRAPGSSIARPG